MDLGSWQGETVIENENLLYKDRIATDIDEDEDDVQIFTMKQRREDSEQNKNMENRQREGEKWTLESR